jgi:hypothetical protein
VIDLAQTGLPANYIARALVARGLDPGLAQEIEAAAEFENFRARRRAFIVAAGSLGLALGVVASSLLLLNLLIP